MSNRTIQSVALRVPELAAAREFYHGLVGLEVISETDDRVVLGAGGEEVVTLHAAPEAPRRAGREAGLFHLALRFPDRRSLADVLARLLGADYPLTGASDHHVSEALYMSDPGESGVELYCDRPRSAWEREASGETRMTTEPLDVDDLRQTASEPTPTAAPDGTDLGHVHLEVTDLERAVVFYRDILGMAIQTTRRGAAFLSWEGYHHHVALNTWSHRRQPHDPETLGLSSVTATLSGASVDAIATRAAEHGIAVDRSGGGLRLTDPDGMIWWLRSRS